jgi:hypothetical protein
LYIFLLFSEKMPKRKLVPIDEKTHTKRTKHLARLPNDALQECMSYLGVKDQVALRRVSKQMGLLHYTFANCISRNVKFPRYRIYNMRSGKKQDDWTDPMYVTKMRTNKEMDWKQFGNLTDLTINNCKLFGGLALGRLGQIKKLKRLDLAFPECGNFGEYMDWPSLTSLQCLFMYKYDIKDDTVVQMWQSLTSLTLASCRIVHSTMEEIAKLDNLRKLDLHFGWMPNEGIECISTMSNLKELSLHIGYGGSAHDGLMHLSNLDLTYLSLQGRFSRTYKIGMIPKTVQRLRIPRRSIDQIKEIAALPNLTHVDIRYSDHVGVRELLPHTYFPSHVKYMSCWGYLEPQQPW